MNPPWYPCSKANVLKSFSSGVKGHIDPDHSIHIPQSNAGRCSRAQYALWRHKRPPNSTKMIKQRWRIRVRSASSL